MAFRDATHSLITALTLVFLANGCATATAGAAPAPRDRIVSLQLFPSDHLDEEGETPLPTVRRCDDERIDVALAQGDDDRCAEEIVACAATSFLFLKQGGDGTQVSVRSYDGDRAVEDALDELEFQRALRRADVAPRDGRIERHEALELEKRVAMMLEGN